MTPINQQNKNQKSYWKKNEKRSLEMVSNTFSEVRVGKMVWELIYSLDPWGGVMLIVVICKGINNLTHGLKKKIL